VEFLSRAFYTLSCWIVCPSFGACKNKMQLAVAQVDTEKNRPGSESCVSLYARPDCSVVCPCGKQSFDTPSRLHFLRCSLSLSLPPSLFGCTRSPFRPQGTAFATAMQALLRTRSAKQRHHAGEISSGAGRRMHRHRRQDKSMPPRRLILRVGMIVMLAALRGARGRKLWAERSAGRRCRRSGGG